MIAVATNVDAPIKLTFESGSRSSLLGLGDIVLPGIFICLALRFDLWRHYNQKIKYVATDLQTEVKGDKDGETVTMTKTAKREVKAPYVSPNGSWGDRFWTASWKRPEASTQLTPRLAAAGFSKTYFTSAMVAYTLGMLFTLAMLLIFKRGQPALLYLVPSVCLATWGTGVVRGELGQMWNYTEDGSLDTQDVVVEVDGDGNVIDTKTSGKSVQSESLASVRPSEKADVATGVSKVTEAKDRDSSRQGHDVFLLSIHAPPDYEADDIMDLDYFEAQET